MEIKDLVKQGHEIWGDERPALYQIIPRMGIIFGDICRWERNALKDKAMHTEEELKKELGNMILSSIRWADDLGYDPEECINLAFACQKKFEKFK